MGKIFYKPLYIGALVAMAVAIGYGLPRNSNPVYASQSNYKMDFLKNPRIRVYKGPFNAVVLRVRDADTLAVRVYPWPSVAIHTAVRLRGIDTPEKQRYKCPEEKALAEQARSYVDSVLKPGDRVQVYNVAFGKYAGRVIASVKIKTVSRKWVSLSDALLAAGYAKPYTGGKKPGWCR